MNNSLYTEVFECKNGEKIPCFKSGKTIVSRYNPQRDIERTLSNIHQNYNFYIIMGAGNPQLIEKIAEQNASILVIEYSENEYNFLNENFEIFNSLKNKSNIFFQTIENFDAKLLNTYIPSIHGDLKIIEQKPWMDEINDSYNLIQQKLQYVIKEIAADFSVQSHFGKIWQNNIINNIKLKSDFCFSDIKFNSNKTAAIIAAGPTLEKTINKIKLNRNDYYIISTDTAFSALLLNEIYPEIVISIDGQPVSYNHFLIEYKNELKNTVFALDLCCNYSITKKLKKINANYFFFYSGHPLSQYINREANNEFIFLFPGSGTVTISGIDLALKMNFKNIHIFGADFAYCNHKSYVQGTYLDKLYNINSNKICSNEFQYSKLMYRTELIKENDRFTSDVLRSYKTSLEKYLLSNNILFSKENEIYILKNENQYSWKHQSKAIDYKTVLEKIKHEDNIMIFAPYYAWLRNKKHIIDLSELQNLAHYSFVRYN